MRIKSNQPQLDSIQRVQNLGMCGNRISVRFRFLKTRTEPNRSQKVKPEISVSVAFLKTELVSY